MAALRLLLILYENHSYVDYGGVDPSTVHKKWLYEGDCNRLDTVTLGHQGKCSHDNETLNFWIIEPQESITFSDALMKRIDTDDMTCHRLLRHLKELRLIDEVAMVFDDDPTMQGEAQPLYPLHVYDRHIREEARRQKSSLGGLATQAYTCLAKSGLMVNMSIEEFRYQTFSDMEWRSGSGFFVYAAHEDTARVVSIYRLRHRPHTEETGKGVDAEEARVKEWHESLSKPFSDCAAIYPYETKNLGVVL
jgi:hypothetical protein